MHLRSVDAPLVVDPVMVATSGDVLLAPDAVGALRDALAVTPIDQHGQPHGARAPEVGEGIERGADGPTGIEDVVHQDDDLAVDPRGWDVGAHRCPRGLMT